MDDYLDAVLKQFAAAGFLIDKIVPGRFTRCKVEGDTGKKQSGWYVVHELRLNNGNSVAVGRYGNWKVHGDEGLPIEFDLPELTPEEKVRFAQEQQAIREQSEKEKRDRYKAAADKAAVIWPKLPDNGASNYLNKKRVGAYGVRFSRGSIVVPVRDVAGTLRGLQWIDPSGDKKFLTGTEKRGGFHLIGDSPAPSDKEAVLWIAEGYATAASVFMATGQSCVVAFDKGNLGPVCLLLREKLPYARLAIAADNDCETDGNPGVVYARQAAEAVGAVVVVPQWPEMCAA